MQSIGIFTNLRQMILMMKSFNRIANVSHSPKTSTNAGRITKKLILLQHICEACSQLLPAEKTSKDSGWTATLAFNLTNFFVHSSIYHVYWSVKYTDHLSEMIQINIERLQNKWIFIEFSIQKVPLYNIICIIYYKPTVWADCRSMPPVTAKYTRLILRAHAQVHKSTYCPYLKIKTSIKFSWT